MVTGPQYVALTTRIVRIYPYYGTSGPKKVAQIPFLSDSTCIWRQIDEAILLAFDVRDDVIITEDFPDRLFSIFLVTRMKFTEN